MAKSLKWVNPEDISFLAKNREKLIAKFDNSRYWFKYEGPGGADIFKKRVRALGLKYGARIVEVKKMWQGAFTTSEPRENILSFQPCSSDLLWIYKRNGAAFVDVTPEELFV